MVHMGQIADMSRALVKEHHAPEERFSSLFPDAKRNGREAVGICPRCGTSVYEGKKGFFCDNRDCSFALWKETKFFSGKKKTITKPVAAALLKEGRVSVSGLYSEKTGKTYDAVVLLDDTGGKYVNFRLEFPAKMSDGKLRETQTANYFSDIYPIDCAVLSANAQSCQKCCTLLSVLFCA